MIAARPCNAMQGAAAHSNCKARFLMKTTAEARAERVAKFGLVTPRIFGIEMEEAHGPVPDWTYWDLEIACVTVEIRHRGYDKHYGPWEASLRLPFGPNTLCKTMPEAQEFIEVELRKLRDALVGAIPP